jgi:hypothetical protein
MSCHIDPGRSIAAEATDRTPIAPSASGSLPAAGTRQREAGPVVVEQRSLVVAMVAVAAAGVVVAAADVVCGGDLGG